MKNFSALVSSGLCISLCFVFSCSSDDPKSFDCSTSDLTIETESKVSPTSCTSNDGSITVSPFGGSSPYTFSLNNGTFSSSAVFEGLGGGSFSVNVKDKNGCIASTDVQLVVPGDNPLTASVNKTPDTECIASNGSLKVVASGGIPPYQFKIGSGVFSDNPAFEGLGPGVYTISVLDTEGCVYTFNATITQGNTGITYTGDILPIFNVKCDGSSCHPSNGDLFVYDKSGTSNDAKGLASRIKSLTQSGAMPRGGEALSSSQKALIACWVDGGAPEN